MARDDPQFNLRMSQELKDMIAERAKSNGRSMNTEIVHILIDGISNEVKAVADIESAKLPKRFKELRNSLPKTESDLATWKDRMLELSFYFMEKIASYTKNHESLRELTKEAEDNVRDNKNAN